MVLADQRVGFDVDNGADDIDKRSPLKRKPGVIEKMKMFTPKFKGRNKVKKGQMELFDSCSSLEFDMGDLKDKKVFVTTKKSSSNDNDNDDRAKQSEAAVKDMAAAPPEEDVKDDDGDDSVHTEVDQNSLGSLTAYNQEAEGEPNITGATEKNIPPRLHPVSSPRLAASDDATPKPPRPRKSSSSWVPTSPPGTPSTGSKLGTSARKVSLLRKRSSGSGSGATIKSSPVPKCDSPRVSWHKTTTATAESPTLSTKSSVGSCGGDVSPLPASSDRSNDRTGTADTETAEPTVGASWKRLSQAFEKDDGAMDGYFSKLQEQQADEDGPASNREKSELSFTEEAPPNQKDAGSKSRIKKLFGLHRSPTKASPKPKAEKGNSHVVDPTLIMEELNSMLVCGPILEPIKRSKSLQADHYSDDMSEVNSIEFPEIPKEKEMSLDDIRKDLTWRRERTTDKLKVEGKPVDSSKELQRNSSSSRRHGRNHHHSSRHSSSSDKEDLSNNGMQSTERRQTSSRRNSSEVEEKESSAHGRGQTSEDAANALSAHRRRRTSKPQDKTHSRHPHNGDVKSSEHSAASKSVHSSPSSKPNRRRHGIRRSVSDHAIKVEAETNRDGADVEYVQKRAARKPGASNVKVAVSPSKPISEKNFVTRLDDSRKASESQCDGARRSPSHRQSSRLGVGKPRSSRRSGGESTSYHSASKENTEVDGETRRSLDTKRRSSDNSNGKSRRYNGHRKTSIREGEVDVNKPSESPTLSDSSREIVRPSSLSQIKSLYAEDLSNDIDWTISESALNYNHRSEPNALEEINEGEETLPSPLERSDKSPTPFSSEKRSSSMLRGSNPRNIFTRTLSMNNVGKSKSGSSLGSSKLLSRRQSSSRKSTGNRPQLTRVEESFERIAATVLLEEKSTFLETSKTEQEENDLGNDADADDDDDDNIEEAALNDAPRSTMSLGEALERRAGVHGRLFDDDGQQTVMSDDGSLWLHEDGSVAVSKIRSSSSVCAPQLDFSAPVANSNGPALGVRHV